MWSEVERLSEWRAVTDRVDLAAVVPAADPGPDLLGPHRWDLLHDRCVQRVPAIAMAMQSSNQIIQYALSILVLHHVTSPPGGA